MADPKLMRIMQLLKTRLSAITTANGFYTDIGQSIARYNRIFNEEECPALALYLTGAETETDIGVLTQQSVTIKASAPYSSLTNAEDVAIKMLADIHKAVEIIAQTHPQTPEIIRKFDEESWQINYPENTGKIVSVEVNYNFAYSRKYGED